MIYRNARSMSEVGQKTEVAALQRDAFFTPESGHWTDIPGGPFLPTGDSVTRVSSQVDLLKRNLMGRACGLLT
jgi:hypothetical protein